MNLLAHSYSEGNLVDYDEAKAFEWFIKAAERGQAVAQYQLGACFEDGEGVQRNLAKAREWYSKAAAQGDSDARGALGRLAA